MILQINNAFIGFLHVVYEFSGLSYEIRLEIKCWYSLNDNYLLIATGYKFVFALIEHPLQIKWYDENILIYKIMHDL